MESFDKTPRSQLNGRMDDEASSEIDQRVASAERGRASRKLIGANTTPDISRSAMSLMSSRKIGSRMRSVISESSAQNIRFPSSTGSKPETTPISSPSFAGFPYHKDAEEERSVVEDGVRGGNLGYEDMLARLEEVRDFYAEAFPNEEDRGGNIRVRESGSATNHPYSSSSPTIPSARS